MFMSKSISTQAKQWKKLLLLLYCAFLPFVWFFFLLHWKKAIFLIIKVKVMADLTGRSYTYLNGSSIPALLCPKTNYLPSLGTKFYLNRNRGY